MKETLCIVASHPGAQRFDFDRKDCDIWGFNEILKTDWYKRADAIFQLHLEPIWRNPKNRNDPNHYHWLRNISAQCNVCNGKGCDHCLNGTYAPQKRDGVKIFMQEHYDDIPNVEKYPIEEVKAMLPNFKWMSASETEDQTYLTSTASMAIALGILKGYKRIECWGMEMNTDTEYRYQRDGVTFWQGVALGRGVELLAMTDIYHAPIYGYEGEAVLPYETFSERIVNLDPEIESHKDLFNEKRIAFNDAVGVAKNGKYEDVTIALKDLATAAFQLHTVDGAIQENERYKKRADIMKEETEGAFQFSRQEFEQSMVSSEQQYKQAETAAHSVAGACQAALDRVKAAKNREQRKGRIKKFVLLANEYIKASSIVGIYAGARQENVNYLHYLDKLIRAAGGEKSEEALLNA